MKNIILGSVSGDAGKTSIIVGLGKSLGKKFSYIKPFGDRLIYRKKRLWDYDAALITNIFGLENGSEDMTIGFEHAKLRYMYDEASTRAKLLDMANRIGAGNGPLFIEGGKNLTYGASVRLDTLSLVRYLGGKLVLVVSGDEGTIIDDITFVKKHVDMTDIEYSVIINKVGNLEDYKNNHLRDIRELGVNVIGVVPGEQSLTKVSVSYIAEKLQARVIAGEGGLNQRVKHVFVGAMSGDIAARLPLFKKENKLAITGGDRTDMIVAALDSSTAGIVLTNNILPSQNIIAKASVLNIPLLLVPFDTYMTAKQIDDMTPLLTRDDTERIDTIHKLVEQNVDLQAIL
ncbi:MAG: phosphotransacetylase family protein [Dehalococcoidales bacterium]|nr:phosphotransacetylase family protein [Dehalococcoidales bacterium]